MGKDRLENFVKDKLGDYQSPVDADEIWAGLEGNIASVNTATTNSVIAGAASTYWKWLAGALLLFAIAGIAFYAGQQSVELSTEKESSVILNSKEIAISTKKEDKSNSNTTSALDNEIATENLDITATNRANTQLNRNTESNSRGNSSTTNLNQAIENTNYTIGSANDGIAISNENEKTFVKNPFEDKVTSDEAVSSILAESTELIETQNDALKIKYNTDKVYTDIGLLDYDNDLLAANINLPKNITCPSFGGSRAGQFSAELQLIPFYSSPRFIAKDEIGENWISRKQNTESYLEAFQINLLGRFQLNNGIYFHAGIGYGQIDEKFNYNSEDVNTITEDNVPVIIILRPNGMSDTIRGNAEVTETNSLVVENYNYHRMIELPFAIGYELGVSQSLGIYADFGGSMNLSTFRKGRMIIDDFDVIQFDDATRPVYKTSTGFKVNGSAGVRYYPGNGISFSVGPEIRYHTGNWIREEHPFEQRYLDVGLRLATSILF